MNSISSDQEYSIAVIGAGHVGLVTAACLAYVGHRMIVVENDPKRLDSLQKEPPKVPIYEPGLQELVTGLQKEHPERLQFTDSISEAVERSHAAFICVGTPQGESGEANLFYVEKVAEEIAAAIAENNRNNFVIIEKSTVPVRTGEAVRGTVERVLNRRNKASLRFEVVSNPEFLAEGTAVKDFLFPDRVVAGVETKKGEEVLRGIYQPIIDRKFEWPEMPVSKESVLLFTDVQSAELIKHASNSFLALKVSFINAVANVCERAGADVREVARGMGLDPRIGRHFLNAGVGFGGYCFPKDVAAFSHISNELGYPFEMLENILKINEGQRSLVVDKLRKALWNLKGKTVAFWGLAFKPDTEDLRGAPSLEILRLLLEEGMLIRAFDPAVQKLPEEFADKVELADSAEAASHGADAIVLVTEWKHFKELREDQLQAVCDRMNFPVFIDGRNLFDPERMRRIGFEYDGIGIS